MIFIRKKTKNPYRANIMILVLFIMFISSLLGLLVSQYVKSLIKISGLFQNYYNAYYYAYAGLELGLSQVKHHGYGFEQGVNNDYIYDYFSGCYLGTGKCFADITITSRWNPVADTYLSTWNDCDTLSGSATSEHKYYTVSSGNAVIIPLFYDHTTGFTTLTNSSYTVFSKTDLTDNIDPTMHVQYTNSTGKYLIETIDESAHSLSINPTVSSSYPDFMNDLLDDTFDNRVDNKNYLIIANADGETKNFCMDLSGSNLLVSKYVTIDSIGTYGNVISSLSAIKIEQLPSFLGYGTINSS